MKRTLITLLALGGVAMGALSETQLEKPANITLQNTATVIDATSILTKDSYKQAFTAVLTLDVNALSVFTTGQPTSGAAKLPLLSWKVDSAATDAVDGIVNISVNNNSDANSNITTGGFYYSTGQEAFTTKGSTTFGTNGTAATKALTNIDWTNAVGAALTITYNGISANTAPLGIQIYFTVAMNDGQLITQNAGNDGTRWTNDAYDVTEIRYTTEYLDALTIYDGYASADQAWTLTKDAAIPEPTTATLSLLALGGLAARRRRK